MVDEFQGVHPVSRIRHALERDRGKNAGPTDQVNGSQGKSGETNRPSCLERAATSDAKLYRAPTLEGRRRK